MAPLASPPEMNSIIMVEAHPLPIRWIQGTSGYT
jgi:hypothetical protein